LSITGRNSRAGCSRTVLSSWKLGGENGYRVIIRRKMVAVAVVLYGLW
jgi:hypothetical protein